MAYFLVFDEDLDLGFFFFDLEPLERLTSLSELAFLNLSRVVESFWMARMTLPR